MEQNKEENINLEPTKIEPFIEQADKSFNFVSKLIVDISKNKELREKYIDVLKTRIDAQKELVKQELNLLTDIEKKKLFDKYLSSVSLIEKQFRKRLDMLEHENEEYEDEIKDVVYEKYYKSLERLEKKWKDKPEVLERERNRKKENLENRLNNIEDRLKKLEEKRKKIYEETITLLIEDPNLDKLKKDLFG